MSKSPFLFLYVLFVATMPALEDLRMFSYIWQLQALHVLRVFVLLKVVPYFKTGQETLQPLSHLKQPGSPIWGVG